MVLLIMMYNGGDCTVASRLGEIQKCDHNEMDGSRAIDRSHSRQTVEKCCGFMPMDLKIISGSLKS